MLMRARMARKCILKVQMAVHVWRDKLVCAASCVGEDVAMVVRTGFVVEYDSVDIELAGMEAHHDCVGSCNTVAIMFGGKWLDEYCIAGMVVGNHYVLVATLGGWGSVWCHRCRGIEADAHLGAVQALVAAQTMAFQRS
jgi:hypothetical protein